MGVDMNDPSAVARFRGQPYPPAPRQFETYHRLIGPRLETQQMYSVCPDSQPPNYQVCVDPILLCVCVWNVSPISLHVIITHKPRSEILKQVRKVLLDLEGACLLTYCPMALR